MDFFHGTDSCAGACRQRDAAQKGRKEEETKKQRKTKNGESGRDVETLHQEAQGTEGILRNNRGGQKGTCPRGRRTLCFQIVGSVQPLERSWVAWDISTVHAPSIAFRHLPPWRKGVVNQCLEFEYGQQTDTGKTSYLCDTSTSHTFPYSPLCFGYSLNLRIPRTRLTLRASLSGTFLQRKDVVNQCLEFEYGARSEHRFPAPSSKPPNSARTGYATEGALFISAQLSTDTVRALRKVCVRIRQSVQART